MNTKELYIAFPILKKHVQEFDLPWLENMVASDPKGRDPFKVLVSCILSLRTQDKTTGEASERLFALAPDVKTMSQLSIIDIEKAIYPVGFYRTKAVRIFDLCNLLIKDYKSRVPDDLDELLKLKGVGRKTANLVITLGYQKPGICVDTHVHRITNRWGYVHTSTPDKTEFALREKLPTKYWLEINALLVGFGQGLCKPISPICNECRISRFCDRVGVQSYR